MAKLKTNSLCALAAFLAAVPALYSSANAQQLIADGTAQTAPPGSAWNTATGSGFAFWALNGGTITALGPVTLSTTGAQAYGALAQTGGRITLNNARVTTTNHFTSALQSFDANSQITGSDITLITSGNGSHGASAGSGSRIVLNNATITVTGSSARTLWADGAGSTISLTGGTLSTGGTTGYAVMGENGGRVDVRDATITTSGLAGFGIRAQTGGSVAVANIDLQTGGAAAYGLSSLGVGSLITATNINILTTGATNLSNSANGVVAEFSGKIIIDGTSTITTQGPNGIGLLSQVGGAAGQADTNLIADGSNGHITITTSGTLAHGALACSRIAGSPDCIAGFGGDIPGSGSRAFLGINDATIKTAGFQAFGLYSYGIASQMDASRVSVATDGEEAHGAVIRNGALLNVTDATLTTTGANAAGLYLTGNMTVVATANLTNTVMSSAGSSIVANGGTGNVTLNTVTAVVNDGFWLNVNSQIPGNPSIINLTASASELKGAAFTGAGEVANVSLTNGTLWTMSGNSNVTTLVNNASTISYTAPVGDPLSLGSYKTLTTTSYVGGGGVIGLNSWLDTDGSPSDLLVIDGGNASGTTGLAITNSGGAGAITNGDGILVVQAVNGATTDATAFSLNGRAAAGAYEYTLYYGGNGATGGNPNDQNWYLRSTINPETPVPGVVVPNVRPEVPVASAMPPLAILYGYAMLDTLHERVGDTYIHNAAPVTEERVVWCKDAARNFKCTARVPVAARHGADRDDVRWTSSGWARLIGNRGIQDRKRFSSFENFLKNGPQYDYSFAGIQAGLDVYAREEADGTLDKAGIYVAYGQISSNVKAMFGGKAGSVDMDAYTLGGYWTHFAPSGWYTDAVVQGTWYSADASSIYGQKISPDGFGILASLEGGYAFKLGQGWTVEPQAQIAYQNVSFNNAKDAYGRYSFADGDSLRGRIGIRLTREWNAGSEADPRLIKAWLRGNIWHEFMGKTKTTVTSLSGLNPLTVRSPLAGTWGEIGAGVTAQMSDSVNLFATGAYSHSLDNKRYQGWDGRLGMTVKW